MMDRVWVFLLITTPELLPKFIVTNGSVAVKRGKDIKRLAVLGEMIWL